MYVMLRTIVMMRVQPPLECHILCTGITMQMCVSLLVDHMHLLIGSYTVLWTLK